MKKNFRSYLNEKIEVPGITETDIGYLIVSALNFANQLHIYHLLCRESQKHVALGALYDGLRDNADKIAENYLALGGELQTHDISLSLIYDDYKIMEIVKGIRFRIAACIDNTNTADTSSLNDKLIDMLECIDSFVYQFDLK